ncbi:monosaccharide ABC transporter membrane protein, CUT2 family [Tistlia consotensis]|uniref:Monosaccharide ABC transporter membrane protein, CUT2 family n=1 Tax=Tistlia consotensis USBA 355 TaxID=560819 RepID=A0A1Y6CHE8_9PROT|nr:ABC transporter permease [Tistlia consotensis]SMF64474.1 monosaccharide ABC transporter membrane protein, CUT2 family [Tistlia consotensis USBA 355]SNR97449.1 monosaccharide ABC transporter membrane protein, CUT2 family [Tistlia consotensis]
MAKWNAALLQPLERAGLNRDRRRILYAFLAAILLFAVGEIVHPGFASPGSIGAIVMVASFVGLVAAGQTFVVLIGGIDLSVPWVLNGASILLVTSSLGQDDRAPWALLLTLGMGAAAGLVNGVAIAFLGVPAVVMTLAMNGIMEGLTLGLSGGLTCGACASYAPPVVADAVHGSLFGIPSALVLWLVVIALVSLLLSFTTFGRRTYATGNNPHASYLAGVNVRLITILLYVLSGLFAALAGILLVGFGGQASLGMGDPYLFQSIAAVVIGGVYMLGGRGHYLGVAAGAVTLVALVSVLLAMNMPDYGRNIIYGIVILLLLLLYGREEAED